MADDDQSEKKSKEEESSSDSHKVVVNGEEKDVNLSDLIANYQKGEDYTQKSQALASDRAKNEEEIERKATEMYLKALSDAEDKDKKDDQDPNEAQDGRIKELEDRLSKRDQQDSDAESDRELKTVMEGLVEKYPEMDKDKVLVKFYQEASESKDVEKLFTDLAKESHDSTIKQRQDIIEKYIEEKTKNPLGSGETGGGNEGHEKPPEPAKTFEEAADRAHRRFNS